MLQALGTNIKAARIAAGISLTTLAKLSGISKGNCSKVERGWNVTVVSLYRICWALGVHPMAVLPAHKTQAVVCDGFEFPTHAEAALHLLWVLQRLSYYEKFRAGQPADGFRFRQVIVTARQLLKELNYEPTELHRSTL